MPPLSFEIFLTFVFYDAPGLPGVVCAHCLELDIVGEGKDQNEAREQLKEAVELYVIDKIEERELETIYRPAPREVWNKPSERWTHGIFFEVPERRARKPHVHFSTRMTQTPSPQALARA